MGLRKALAALPHEAVAESRSDRYVALGAESEAERVTRRELQRCIKARSIATIAYRSAGALAAAGACALALLATRTRAARLAWIRFERIWESPRG